ncbi:type II toxin-antitoxin system RelE family toxin [Hymenobacter nivis]|uniref:type II toxin-antitoxin system RelE family toxin n=1 Tax=Hymenobacter nivis TaxID=1850093 RepID=UPI0013A551D2|nr:type II toxin-antitoxin system RelE/ParE family toxin [Hymenobacter nivis]
MKTAFSSRFLRDLDKLPNAAVKSAVADVIEAVEVAANLTGIVNLKKLKGYKMAYRIRVGDFRIGVFITGGEVEFARVVDRKDIYKLFP